MANSDLNGVDKTPPPCPVKVGDRVRAKLGNGNWAEGVVDDIGSHPLTGRMFRIKNETRDIEHPHPYFHECQGHWDDVVILESADPPASTSTADAIREACSELADFLIEKNAAYGDSALDPVRIMSSADPIEQIKVRMDDKLSRMVRGKAAGEDAVKDFVGYWVMLQVAERKEGE